jgi:hypothetical protein
VVSKIVSAKGVVHAEARWGPGVCTMDSTEASTVAPVISPSSRASVFLRALRGSRDPSILLRALRDSA